jgi:predicted metal-dependent peptidase
MSIEWVPSNMGWLPLEKRRLGIRIVNGGQVQVLYNKEYTESRTISQLIGEIQHIIEHLVRLHPVRSGGLDKELFGVGADIAVNGKKASPRIGYKDKDKNILPHDNMIFCPEAWDDNLSAEEYYKLLQKETGRQKPQHKCPQCGKPIPQKGKQGQGQGQGKGQQDKQGSQGSQGSQQNQDKDQNQQDGEGKCPGCEQEKNEPGESPYSNYGETCDDHSVWSQSDVSEDEARQVVKEICKQASEKSQGHIPGHLVELIKELDKPVHNWREIFRSFLGTHVGNKRLTWSRRNRKQDVFGLKGISHHAAATLSIIVDTSGSVSSEMLKKFFTEIEAISYKTSCSVLQYDHAFQGYSKYRRSDWKKIKIHGRGGTDMNAPLIWLEQEGLVGDACVMLTDGFVGEWPAPRSFPMIFCIANEGNSKPPSMPAWGTILEINMH